MGEGIPEGWGTPGLCLRLRSITSHLEHPLAMEHQRYHPSHHGRSPAGTGLEALPQGLEPCGLEADSCKSNRLLGLSCRRRVTIASRSPCPRFPEDFAARCRLAAMQMRRPI